MYCQIAVRPRKRKQQKHTPCGQFTEQAEKLKASIRAKTEHPFRVIKRQYGGALVCYLGPAKNKEQLLSLFALSDIWMVRKHLCNGLRLHRTSIGRPRV